MPDYDHSESGNSYIARLNSNSKVLPIVTPAPPKQIIPHRELQAFLEIYLGA
jgi:hypothetical protein